MSTSVAYKGSVCTGHECFAPRRSITGSDLLYLHGFGSALTVGDQWEGHRCDKSWHAGIQSSGSTLVFINSAALARIGDEVSCGSAVAQGADFVFSD